MVNIWDYANTRPRICLKTKSGEECIGKTYMVWDADESDDTEDSITIELDSGEIKSFYHNEIESIEVLSNG